MSIIPPMSAEIRKTDIVLGKNIGEQWDASRVRHTPNHLSPWSEIGVEAAGTRIANQTTDIVIFTVGNTAGKAPLTEDEGIASQDSKGVGRPPKAEAHYMTDLFKELYPNLAERAFVQPRSWDTNTDAKEIEKLMEAGKIDPDSWYLGTIGFHLERALRLFRRRGLIPTDAYATEDMLGPKRAAAIKDMPLYKEEEKKEANVRRMQFFPNIKFMGKRREAPILGKLATETVTAITSRTRG